MKKLLSFILVSVFVVSSLGSVAFASEPAEIEIISPEGDSATNLSDITVKNNSGKEVEKYIYKIDGAIVGETEGIDKIVFSDGFVSSGNHKLEVAAIFDDGTAAVASKVCNIKNSVRVMSYVENLNSYVTGQEGTVGLAPNTKSKADVSSVAGRSGDSNDKAFNFAFNTNSGVTSGQPYADFSRFSSVKAKGVVTLEFDLKSSDDKTLLRLTGIPTKELNFIDYGAFVLNSNCTIAANTWNRIKVRVDYTYSDSSVWLSVTNTKENGTVDSVYDGEVESRTAGTIRLNFFQRGSRTESTRASYTLDNFDFSQEEVYGIEEISYTDQSVTSSSEVEIPVIPTSTTSLNIALTTAFNPSDVTSENVKLYENGLEVDADVNYNESAKTVSVSPKRELNKGSDVVVKFSQDITISGTTVPVGTPLESRYVTEAAELTPKSISFKMNGSSELVSTSQITNGDDISANVSLYNNASDGLSKDMTVILFVKQDGVLLGINASSVNLEYGEGQDVSVSVNDIAGINPAGGEVTVKLCLCDTVKNATPYMPFTEIK